jgi:hypothetical protein
VHVAHLLRALGRQTIRSRIEIVLLVPSRASLDQAAQNALSAFGALRVVETGPMTSLPAARAAGVRAASAPIVVLTEDHCFPAPEWAEAMVRAHAGPWAAVGPVFEPPVPGDARARAACLMQYASWTHPARTGEVADLPGHNSSYKRDVLLAYGDRLPAMLVAESVLHWDLRRQGHRLWLEDGARVRHVYMTRRLPSFDESFYIARTFAGRRASRWSVPRRAAFALASPLVPVVRFARIVPRALDLGWGRALPRIVPALVPLLVVSAVGELIGCVFGVGTAEGRGVDLDTRRHRFVSPEVKEMYWPAEPDDAGLAARASSPPVAASGGRRGAAPAPRS